MRLFEHFNQAGKCNICGTNEDKPCVLVGIKGTKEGNIMQAMQIHLDCIDLTAYTKDDKEGEVIIAMWFKDKGAKPVYPERH